LSVVEREDTKQRIIEAAFRLFAQGGEEATSLRAITREAGVNVAAVHYHFKGRHELLEAVLNRVVVAPNQRRVEHLHALATRHGGQVPLEELLSAFLRPQLELLSELRPSRVQLARFLGRSYSQPGPAVASFAGRQFESLSSAFHPLLERALPAVSPQTLRLRMQLVIAVITSLFANAAPTGGPPPLGTEDVDEQLARLIAFFAPGLAAPGAGEDHS
jgi:AcrR family transcriptional regulator